MTTVDNLLSNPYDMDYSTLYKIEGSELTQRIINYLNEYYKIDPNDKFVIISMIHRRSGVRVNTVIDEDDFDLVSSRIWYPHHDKTKPKHLVYVYSGGGSKSSKLHRFIMNPSSDMVVDHLNRNPLDNRKLNMRICTIAENNRNMSMNKSNTSGERGVYFHRTKRRWFAFRGINGKLYNKSFKTREEAVKYRKEILENL